ncbi:MAG: hypothetical protein GF315_00300, partial [candidate division Zixibacteria bacterium]|nr:hypothetical protein [candidate division Zixibacteria bacterium]
MNNINTSRLLKLIVITISLLLFSCSEDSLTNSDDYTVPHEQRWGIYSLNLASEEVELIFSIGEEISGLKLNHAGDKFAFSRKIGGDSMEDEEICVVNADGSGLTQLTSNNYLDTYPCWSPDDSQIAFLSWQNTDLDIFIMDADGGNAQQLYDSGSHDADIDWAGDSIVFTAHSQIWMIRDDGTQPVQLTDPPRAGEWGNANLPFGDYDPRFSPDGSKIVFERLEDDQSVHGNYDIYYYNSSTGTEEALTNTGYSQGLASRSYSG